MAGACRFCENTRLPGLRDLRHRAVLFACLPPKFRGPFCRRATGTLLTSPRTGSTVLTSAVETTSPTSGDMRWVVRTMNPETQIEAMT